MEYHIRFSQTYETFRLPEIQALAIIEGIPLEVVSYSPESPFCIVKLPSPSAAQKLIRRSILVQSIHELWGQGATLPDLHASVHKLTAHLWPSYNTCSFKFTLDSYQGSRSGESKIAIINQFAYTGFAGPIKMRNPDEEFTLFEDWEFNSTPLGIPDPKYYYLGRFLGIGMRDLPKKLDLKKRRYISTTSMDAELALVTANIALAGPGKLFYDPFVGTGSFPLACAEFGALTFGSDIDGRSIRGDEKKKTLRANFEQYGTVNKLGGMFTADLTNSPIRRKPLGQPEDGDGVRGRIFDGIVCDPPYGVREGLKVLGVKDPEKNHWVIPKGKEMYKQPDFIPPRKPYSFIAMLDDILQFAAQTLVDNGRLSFWMPTANDQDQEIAVPSHPYMEVVAISTQVFNKWSRRLITYRRIPDSEVDPSAVQTAKEAAEESKKKLGKTADDLNPFRKLYFEGFGSPASATPRDCGTEYPGRSQSPGFTGKESGSGTGTPAVEEN